MILLHTGFFACRFANTRINRFLGIVSFGVSALRIFGLSNPVYMYHKSNITPKVDIGSKLRVVVARWKKKSNFAFILNNNNKCFCAKMISNIIIIILKCTCQTFCDLEYLVNNTTGQYCYNSIIFELISPVDIVVLSISMIYW